MCRTMSQSSHLRIATLFRPPNEIFRDSATDVRPIPQAKRLFDWQVQVRVASG